MPVEVLGEHVERDRDLRSRAAVGDVTGLVAGQLDRPVLRIRVEQFQQGHADVAGERGAAPAARSRCASIAVLVLLPLVPVMHTALATTPSSPARVPNHNAVPPTRRVPVATAACASALYGLIPGDFTTTS